MLSSKLAPKSEVLVHKYQNTKAITKTLGTTMATTTPVFIVFFFVFDGGDGGEGGAGEGLEESEEVEDETDLISSVALPTRDIAITLTVDKATPDSSSSLSGGQVSTTCEFAETTSSADVSLMYMI